FQAEDGIRDDLVTGVQTCALPISSHTATFRSAIQSATSAADGRPSGEPTARCRPAATPHPNAMLETALTGSASPPQTAASAATRSEERRVGKECRSGWSEERA